MRARVVIQSLAAVVASWGASAGAEPSAPPTPESRLGARIALQLETARGRLTGDFRNQLAGLRVDLVFTPRVSFGGYVGYANLKGKDGRVPAALSYAQIEYLATPLPRTPKLRLPLRFATGYLTNNGPVARAAAGLSYALSPTLDLVGELFTPMLWVTNDQMLLSTNLSLELAMRF